MRVSTLTRRVCLALAMAALAGANARADLVLEGTLTPAGGTPEGFYVTDNNTAYPGGDPPGTRLLDLDPTTGVLSFSLVTLPDGLIGTLTVTESTTNGLNTIDTNTGNSGLANPGLNPLSLDFSVGDNGFVGPANSATPSASVTFDGGNNSFKVLYYDDPTNSQPLAGPNPTQRGNLVAQSPTQLTDIEGPTLSYGPGNVPLMPADGSTFAMTTETQISLAGLGVIVSLDQQEAKSEGPVSVPEPTSLALLGSGLVGIGLIRRRRTANRVAAKGASQPA